MHIVTQLADAHKGKAVGLSARGKGKEIERFSEEEMESPKRLSKILLHTPVLHHLMLKVLGPMSEYGGWLPKGSSAEAESKQACSTCSRSILRLLSQKGSPLHSTIEEFSSQTSNRVVRAPGVKRKLLPLKFETASSFFRRQGATSSQKYSAPISAGKRAVLTSRGVSSVRSLVPDSE